MDNLKDIYDVAIVGLGPTGLTLAHLLGRRGLSVLALEREPEFYGNARAVYTDDECMRVFQAAGVAADLEADMLLDTPVQWVLEDGSVLAQLRRTDRPFGWAVSNFFYQPYLETKMERLLARYPNVTVLQGARAGELRPGRRRGGRRARRKRRLAIRPGAGRRAEAIRKRSRPRAMARRLRRRPQRRAHQPRHQDGREELPRAVARGRHQGEGGRGLLPSHALFQLPLRPQGADRLLPAAERPSPVRVPADARPDQGADGGPRDRPRAPRAPCRRRQGRGAAAARLHVQRARRRAVARRAGAARGRRRAYDAAIHGPGHELGGARRA